MPTEKDFTVALLQTGLENAERTLQVLLEKSERNLQIALEAAEKRINEKFITQKEIADKNEKTLAERLHTMNMFREQIFSERALYLTRDQLNLITDARFKALEDKLALAWTALNIQQGAEKGQIRVKDETRSNLAILGSLLAVLLTILSRFLK